MDLFLKIFLKSGAIRKPVREGQADSYFSDALARQAGRSQFPRM